MAGRRVGRLRTAPYGSKAYLRSNTHKRKFDEYDWVAFDARLSHLSQAKWVNKYVPEERIALRLDSLLAMVQAVRHGIGIGLLLCLLADGEKDLMPLGEPIRELDTDLWILVHPDVRRLARVKAFTDFLFKKLSNSAQVESV